MVVPLVSSHPVTGCVLKLTFLITGELERPFQTQRHRVTWKFEQLLHCVHLADVLALSSFFLSLLCVNTILSCKVQ